MRSARWEKARAEAAVIRTRSTPGPFSGMSSASGSTGVSDSSWASMTTRSSSPSQARAIALDLRGAGAYVAPDREVIALIAYLQMLGTEVDFSTYHADSPANQR